MRPLPQSIPESLARTRVGFLALLAAGAWTLGCGGGGAAAAAPPPPPSFTVSVVPPSGSVVLGNQVTFTAIVTNTTDTTVGWSVNDISGGNSTVGTISSTGVYTAPADLPSPATMQITVASHADPTKSATASITVTSDITLSLTPNPASIELGARQSFQATVTSSGHPDTTVRWSLSGAAWPTACGTLDSSGTFTAPGVLPSPASVIVTAQSVADPSKQISATESISSNFTLQLSAPPSVNTGASATGDPNTTFAAPQALPLAPKSYDLESVLTHELGHFLGFSHSPVWSAMMFPYAPAPGTISGTRPTAQQPDAPLGDDDRSGLRVLYPDPADTLHQGSISGRIIPANPLALPAFPPRVTGVFGVQVVAVNNATGAVIGATLGGWSCAAPGPAQFDGTYQIAALPVGSSYTVYAEVLNGAANASQFSNALTSLCRNAMTDAGWPPLQACIVPAVDISFTARTRPGP